MERHKTRRSLSHWVKSLRLKQGKTITEVAEGAGISRSTVYRIESAESAPSVEVFDSVCRYLKVNPCNFWAELKKQEAKETPPEAITE